MRVFVDANTLFSASLPHSRLSEFLEVVKLHGECLYSGYAFDEAQRNLMKKYPGGVPSLEKLSRDMTRVANVQRMAGVAIREKDEPILSSAIAAQATHLLTGDKRDFGPFFGTAINGVKVATAALLAQKMADQRWLE